MSEGNGKPSNPFVRCVPLALSVRLLGVSRQVKTAKKNTGDEEEFTAGELTAGDDLVRVNKKILECPEYEAVQSQAGTIRAYLRKREVPGGKLLFRAGTYPIPITKVGEVEAELKAMEGAFTNLVRAFVAAYPQRVEESKKRLKAQNVLGNDYDLANDSDYPPVEEVAKEFWVQHQWIEIGPAQAIANFDLELYQREVAKVERLCQNAARDVETALKAGLQELLDHFISRLRPDEKGQRKSLNAGVLKNVKEFLSDLKDKNITGDQELETLAERCRAVVDGLDLTVLKESDATRRLTAAKLDQVKKLVDASIVNQPKRIIKDLPD